ncbi:hypothetical protein [Spirillospora sp. NPDC029432]|uniref:hypothetical protein n=1 Tax=Spirillospora sp. NPDC029432 TaxID=3154599 RepID=UPI003453AC2F
MRRFPQTFAIRLAAERVLWKLAEDGHADTVQDDRLRALILLAAFASLRWGEITALRRCGIDTVNRTVRVRAAYVERAIADGLDALLHAENAEEEDGDGGTGGALVPVA